MRQDISISAIICFFTVLSITTVLGDKIDIEQTGSVDFDEKTIDYFTHNGESGILTAFQGTTEMNCSPHRLSCTLPENDFKGEFLIINQEEGQLELRLLCLLDYRQAPFTLDQESSGQHYLSVEQSGKKRLRFALGGIMPGAHDLILLAIDRMDKPASNIGDSDHLFFHRLMLFAGTKRMPQIKTQIADNVSPTSETTYSIRCKIEKPQFSVGNSNYRKFKRPHTRFYLQINNPENEPSNYAVLTFLNEHQLDLIRDDAVDTQFWKVPPRSRGTIPVDVDTRAFRSGDVFMILCVENPFAYLETRTAEIANIRAQLHVAYRNMVKF